ncbi:acid protease [Punctularia strigosozonata HHB-11173 SS5]|uniref:acid protease n=1 Tax=Punctularia strigosozonata (strain HHB-11173) TaxID=741275 RepID=UPI0004417FDF|nr:acid protease [Punctularia strigosozonata HHB-11173 SS5]EIN11477.1 acid protease [Punctularia strigosozonata HHB-11173 SS5]
MKRGILSASAILALSAYANATPSPNSRPEPIHVPLRRRAGRMSLEKLRAHADFVRAKYNYPTINPSSRRKRGNTAGISIIDQDTDSSYIGEVNVGTPTQTFKVVLDTGSSDFWLASSSCTQCPSGIPEYDSSSSSSFSAASSSSSDSVDIPYGSGEVAGSLATETVEMGGFEVSGQTFLLVDEMTSGLLDGDVSGIMGLAFESIAATEATPFWQTLVNNDQLTNPEMSFWLERVLGTSDTDEEQFGGIFTLGGTNTSLYSGDIEFIDYPSGVTESYWLLETSKITVGGSSISIQTGSNALAAIDTGTTLIGGPTNDVANFWAAVDGSQALTGNNAGFYAFPCSATINATFAFGGKDWAINPTDMNVQELSSSLCLGAVFDLSQGSNVGGSGTPAWVVGDTFLKNVYSVFRSSPAAIGFAELSTTAGGSGTSTGELSIISSGRGEFVYGNGLGDANRVGSSFSQETRLPRLLRQRERRLAPTASARCRPLLRRARRPRAVRIRLPALIRPVKIRCADELLHNVGTDSSSSSSSSSSSAAVKAKVDGALSTGLVVSALVVLAFGW